METKQPSFIWNLLKVIAWVLFILLCIKAGALLFTLVLSVLVDANVAKDMYNGLSLYDILEANQAYFLSLSILMIVITGLKAHIALLIARFMGSFESERPFSDAVSELTFRIAKYGLITGGLALIATALNKWIAKQGFTVYAWGAEETLFFAGVLYVLAVVFKKGNILQQETDLTI